MSHLPKIQNFKNMPDSICYSGTEIGRANHEVVKGFLNGPMTPAGTLNTTKPSQSKIRFAEVNIKFLCFQGFQAIVDSSLEFPLASRGGIIIRPGHVVTTFLSLRVKSNLIS